MLTTKNDNTTATAPGGARLAMRLPTAASTMKLYGQMTPKTHGGGCQEGFVSDWYHPASVLTQTPGENCVRDDGNDDRSDRDDAPCLEGGCGGHR